MINTSKLSSADVERLLTDKTAQARIDTMAKVVSDLKAGMLGNREATIARDLLERFARDAENAVREAVAWQIYNSPLLSDDLAKRLANDVGSVAFPILRHAQELADDFLLEVIRQRDAEKQVAIAGRPVVSPTIADAIVETANLSAIGTLLRNEGAEIQPPTLEKVADRYGDLSFVAEPLAERPQLPMAVVEKLISRVSEDLRRQLVDRYRLAPEMVAEMINNGREAATVLMLHPIARHGTDVELFAHHLMVNGRLTPSLLFRVLCSGDIDLFIAGMAVRAGITVENARTLLLDDGGLALRAVFDRARVSALLIPPFRSALNVVKQLAYRGEDERRRYFQVAVLARVHADCSHIEERAVDDLLMQLFDQKTEDMIEQAMEMADMPFTPLREGSCGARA